MIYAPTSKFCLVVFIFLFCFVSCPAPAVAQSLRVGVLNDFPPQYVLNDQGQPDGLAVSLFEQIIAQTDLQIEYMIYDSWTTLQDALQQGEIDIVPDMGIADFRKQWASFSVPLETFQISLFVRTGNNALQFPADFIARPLGVVESNVGEKIANPFPDLNLKSYPDVYAAFHGLLSGQVDGVLFPQPTFYKIARESKLEDRITVAGDPLREIKRGIAVSKNNEALLAELNPIINQFVLTETYRNIYSQWYGRPAPFWTVRTVTLYAALIIIFLGVILVYWRYQSLKKMAQSLASEVKKQTFELAQNEYKYRSLYENAPLPYQSLDDNGCFLDINNAWLRTLGYQREEVIGQWFGNFLFTDYVSEFEKNFPTFKKRGYVKDVQFKIMHKEGHFLEITFDGSIAYSAAGTFERTYCVFHDITEKKQLENALREERDFTKSIIDTAQAIILILDPEGKIQSFNPYMEKLCGHALSDVIGEDWFSTFLPRDEQEKVKGAFQKVFNNSQTNGSINKIVTKKGDELDIEWSSETLKHENGEVIGILSIGKDVTQRQKTLEALEESENRYRELIDNLPSGLVVHATDSSVLYSNPMASKLLGLNQDQMNGKQAIDSTWCFLRDNGSTLPVAEYPVMRVLETKESASDYSLGIQRPVLDEPVWVQCNAHPRLNNDAEVEQVVVVFNDITSRKQAEEQRREIEDQLRQKHKMEAVGYMAGGMAHNFNNNLSIILGNVELSQMKQAPGSEVTPLLENAKIAVRRSRDLVQKIITYSRQGIQNTASMQLTTIIDETIDLLTSTLPTTVTLKKDFAPDCKSKMINADASQIQEVLINLCNNAIHAMDEKGELKISLNSIELKQQNIPAQYNCHPGQYAKLSVQDSGCGIPAEMLDKIFDPFYSTKEEYEGAGIGLSTVQGIVAQHGGLIKVNSALEQGTVFDLYFPIIEHTVNGEAESATRTANSILSKGSEHILFVDDDEILAKLGEQLLSEMGYLVSVMTDSHEALKLFSANGDRFDLVITDQTMPQLTGTELITEIKKIRADIPTILCTGYSSKVDEEKAADLGISAFMMKPLDLPVLSQTVRRILDENKEK